MSKWVKVKLVDVCDFQGGSQPPKEQWKNEYEDGYIRMLQIRDFTQDRDGKEEYVKVSSSIKTCVDSDILIARYGASVGKILTGLSGAYNVAIMKTIPDTNKLIKRYLRLFLLSDVFQNFIKNVGSRAAQAGFNKMDLENILIPLPPISTQEKISTVIDFASDLLNLRKKQLAELENLIKSIFYEMFGDPIINEKRWKVEKLDNICNKITDGKHGDCRSEDNSGCYFISAKDIVDGQILYANARQINFDDFFEADKRTSLEFDDIIVVNTGATIGKSAIIKNNDKVRHTTFQKSVGIIQTNKQMLCSNYLLQYINIDRERIYSNASGSAQKNWLLSQMRCYEIMLPPIEIQEIYLKRITKIEEQKTLIQKSIDETQHLFDSLMSQYFD